MQGKAPVAAQAAKNATPQVFALASAHPEQFQGQLAIALEFSHRLAGSQAFDTLIDVKDAKGGVVNGSWALDEDGGLSRSMPTTTPTTSAATVATAVASTGIRDRIHRGVLHLRSVPDDGVPAFTSAQSRATRRRAREDGQRVSPGGLCRSGGQGRIVRWG